ncbi:substrate-binding domain-containing protein [Agrococcus jejuensis]|uniref:Monosaccharide ABC transporter substrate-binding protein, CUT2 family n=1 Tax=Agrococcus jejuensis TaxID=399736 RepID=A0A1G8FMD4_9MICO|nr:substrate-binding domain-containing protein [Agrococcus jejuensis]SDH83211.1 monosaccharide ABC transporter substrate-binding protein, CUT2 family [Agrococcus jejuensis]
MIRRHRMLAMLALPLAAGVVLSGCSSESVGGDDAPDASGGTSDTGDFASIIPDGDIVAASQEIVDASLDATEGFTPPSEGPQAQQSGATIAFVGSDLTNGGINAVAEGVEEAAEAIGWTVNVYDGQATAQGRSDAMAQAIASGPAAIVVGGFDPTEQATAIQQAGDSDIPVVGWHAGAEAGPGNGLFTNVTTDPLDVAQLAGAYVVADSDGTAGVAIFTDGQYDIAVLKADAMQAYVEACDGCQVLDYQDSPIAESGQRMPGLISNLLQTHGDDLTYLMAINGNYFGGAQQALSAAGTDPAGPPYAVAAGDGDAAEFQRIRNEEYQAATVAEPLYLQGWQIVDEVNRALAGEDPSGFVPAPGLVTVENVPDGDVFDPDSGYRDVYRSVWGV